MNRLEKIFARKSRALMISDVCGVPDSPERLRMIINSGADIVNLIIPFSDPMADGAVIQQAAQKALSNGATLQKILQMIKVLRGEYPETGMIVSGYCNVFMQYGWEKLFAELAELEIDGIAVSDMPFEERSEIASFTGRYNVPFIVDTGLTADKARLQKITAGAGGLVVCGNVQAFELLKSCSPVPAATAADSGVKSPLVIASAVEQTLPELAAYVEKSVNQR